MTRSQSIYTLPSIDMKGALGRAQFTVGKHLKVLEEAELIAFTTDGLWGNYSLGEGAKNQYTATLIGNLRHWLEEDEDVAALIARLPGIDREIICCG